MNDSSGLIDFSTWTGQWPFIHLNNTTLEKLQQKLTSLNIRQAFVSPIEAILEQDPMRANKHLLQQIKTDFFSPVPIVDLSYANWEEIIQLSVNDGRVRMIKLLPNYHMYELDEKRLEPLVKLAQQHRLLIAVQIRIEDPRGQHPLMKVPCVDVNKIIQPILRFPEQIFILQNLFIGELNGVLSAADHVYADTSSLEQIDVLQTLQEQFTLERILFASHAPFYFPEGNTYKLKYSEVNQEQLEKVAYRNAQSLIDIRQAKSE